MQRLQHQFAETSSNKHSKIASPPYSRGEANTTMAKTTSDWQLHLWATIQDTCAESVTSQLQECQNKCPSYAKSINRAKGTSKFHSYYKLLRHNCRNEALVSVLGMCKQRKTKKHAIHAVSTCLRTFPGQRLSSARQTMSCGPSPRQSVETRS